MELWYDGAALMSWVMGILSGAPWMRRLSDYQRRLVRKAMVGNPVDVYTADAILTALDLHLDMLPLAHGGRFLRCPKPAPRRRIGRVDTGRIGGKPYPQAIVDQIVAAVLDDGEAKSAVAESFGVHERTVRNYVRAEERRRADDVGVAA